MRSNILSLLLFVVILLAVILAKKMASKYNHLMTWKNNGLFAAAYLGVFLILVPISIYLLNNGLYPSGEEKSQRITKAPDEWNKSLAHLYLDLDGDKLQELYQSSSQTFQFKTNRLTLAGSSNKELIPIIYIERKETDDGEIGVSTYTIPHYAGYFDFTKLVLPPEISVENGSLLVKESRSQNLEFKHFKPDFTVQQFKDNPDSYEVNTAYLGWKVILLRIPKNLEIINSGGFEVRDL